MQGNPEEVELARTAQRREKVQDLLQALGSVKTREKLEPEEIFKAVRVLTEGEQALSRIMLEEEKARTEQRLKTWIVEFLMGAFGFTLVASFGLLFLHSFKVIELPSLAVTTVSVSVPGEVLTLIGLVVKYLFFGAGRSGQPRRGGR